MNPTGWSPVPTSLTKLHATENDFLVHVALDGEPRLSPETVRRICDRRAGVGADGLITLGPPTEPDSDCSFRLRNADGSEAEMSGNGMRCLAAVAAQRGLGDGKRLVVDTLAGPRVVDLELDDHGAVTGAVVDMGAAGFDPAGPRIAQLDGAEYAGEVVSMGNPHWVLFVDDPARLALDVAGPRLEHDERFPNRTNVEFVRVDARDALTMRVWERGAGETRSCGTGACAAAAAAHHRGLVDSEVTVTVPGGRLDIEIGATIRLGGPVVEIATVWVDTGGGR